MSACGTASAYAGLLSGLGASGKTISALLGGSLPGVPTNVVVYNPANVGGFEQNPAEIVLNFADGSAVALYPQNLANMDYTTTPPTVTPGLLQPGSHYNTYASIPTFLTSTYQDFYAPSAVNYSDVMILGAATYNNQGYVCAKYGLLQ